MVNMEILELTWKERFEKYPLPKHDRSEAIDEAEFYDTIESLEDAGVLLTSFDKDISVSGVYGGNWK